jgi:hypothetical protein
MSDTTDVEADTYTCPADDCGYTGFWKPVLAHYSGTQDPEHEGGYNRARQFLEEQGADPDADTGSNTGADAEDRTENPTFGSGDPGSSGGSQTDTSAADDPADDDPACPDCGGELYDFTGYESGGYHKVNGYTVMVQGDYQCSDCHAWWVDV